VDEMAEEIEVNLGQKFSSLLFQTSNVIIYTSNDIIPNFSSLHFLSDVKDLKEKLLKANGGNLPTL
jgi:hypothetical protein